MQSSVQSLSHIQIFATPWTAEPQASLSISNSWNLLTLMAVKSVMPSNYLILCHPLFLLPSFPASGSFPRSRFLASGDQSIGVSASASVLPVNIQDWFPLEWTVWISVQTKGLSRVFPTPQFKSISSSVLSFIYSPTLTSTHNCWKNHSLD